jgi:hypothetical protein
VNNTPGVQEYATYSDGINATAQTLLNGNYNAMIALMRSGADLKTIASNPSVQQNLRTWQGGSNEDVRNLANTANLPGKETTPAPSKVGEFAAQLQGSNIDPKEFTANFATLAAQRRKLLGSARTSVSDYADMQNAALTAGEAVSPAFIAQHVGSQPHPTFSNVTAGDFQATFDRARMYSMIHESRFPTMSETAGLVGLDHKAMIDYFERKAAAAPTAQPAPAAQPNNVLKMPQQREQQTA